MKNRTKGLVLAVTGGFLALGALGLNKNINVGWTSDAMAATDDSTVKVECAQNAVKAYVADPTFSLSFATSIAGTPVAASSMTLANAVAGDTAGSPTAALLPSGITVIDVASPLGKVTGFQCSGVNKVEHTASGVNSTPNLSVAYRSWTGSDGSSAGSFYTAGQADTATVGAPRYIAAVSPSAILPEIADGGAYDNDGSVNSEVIDGGNGVNAPGAFNLQVSLPVNALAAGGLQEVITHSYVVH